MLNKVIFNMANIAIKWFYIAWEKGYTWKKDILPQLEKSNMTEQELVRVVYVVRTKGQFSIEYAKGSSPVLYIGEGNFKNRINSHRKRWLSELIDLVGDFPIEIAVSIPRARNNTYVYRDVEADLIWEFYHIYGMVPFFNGQKEYSKKYHEYKEYYEFIKPLQIGKGKRIPWTIKPSPSNKHYERYHKANE